ncbi:preprotein translocase subunit SecY [Candidatus Woesearchaeota archaeon]|nr:preprotein translocase subunit SecY [Candidatus Woesearchaeota archaeon]
MSFIDTVINYIPEVAKPTQKRLSFQEKLKWTGIILVIFYLLGVIPLLGLGVNALANFQFLSIILGAEFGSIISLGIGPIVTASIVLQLLNGSHILKFDLQSEEGKRRFTGVQKLLSIFFIVFEAIVYVFLGGLQPNPGGSHISLVLQLMLGGVLILLMDDVISKWGFGSGISLFIAAGVAKSIMVRFLSPFSTSGGIGFPFSDQAPVGALWEIFYGFSVGDPSITLLAAFAILFTILVFVVAVYGQAMKVEVPLSFGRIRGHGVRWPLAFIYTSNIPVILIAALLANLQLWARLLENSGRPFLGIYDPSGSGLSSGLIAWLSPVNIPNNLIVGTLTMTQVLHTLSYVLFLMLGAVVFSIFWVQTSGQDARSISKQIMNAGLQIPGFRRDERVLERLLQRYINPLTVMGALTVGFLAALADVSGALTNGTGLLLTVMIIYRLYEEIAKQHAMDMFPAMRRFVKT